MVLGPNGTGKSALLCGMIVGLAGDPSDTGRSGSMVEYIKFGCDWSVIEIEVHDDQQAHTSYVIERKLISVAKEGKLKNDCKSEWKLNNKPSKASEVKELVSRLNIRVDNLCQMLPQEKVIEFAKMNNIELLENTEKAVGDVQMFEDHQNLKLLTKEVNELESKKTNLSGETTEDAQLNLRLELDVKRLQERKKMQEQVRNLEMKKPWLVFEEYRKDYVEVKTKVTEKQTLLSKNKQKVDPLKKKVKNCETALAANEETISQLSSKFEAATAAVRIKTSQLERMTECEPLREYKIKLRVEDQRKQELESLKSERHTLEQTLLTQRAVADVGPQIEKLSADQSQFVHKVQQLNDEKSNLSNEKDELLYTIRDHKREIEIINNLFNKKMEKVKSLSKDAFSAAQWLSNNRDKFKKNIFPPLMTQINVKEKRFAKYLESAIPRRDFTTFLCEDEDDLRKFTNYADDQRLRLAVAMIPDTAQRFEPDVNIKSLAAFGFTHYVKDIFTAPPQVMTYLCYQYKLHNIPVGDDRVSECLERIQRETSLRIFYSGDRKYSNSRSRYDNKPISTNDRIQDASQLDIILDSSKLKQQRDSLAKAEKRQESIDSQLTDIDREVVKLQNSVKETKKKLQDLQNQRTYKETLIQKIANKDKAIQRKQSEAVCLNEEKARLVKKLEGIDEKRLELLTAYAKAVKKCSVLQVEKMKMSTTLVSARDAKLKAEAALREANSEFQVLEQEIRILIKKRDELKISAQKKRTEARQHLVDLNIEMGANDKLPDDIKAVFDSLPNTVDEVEDSINSLNGQIQTMAIGADDNVEEDYNRRKKDIRRKQAEMLNIEDTLAKKKSEIEKLRERWLGPLINLIERINGNFGKLMSKLQYAGEVVLRRDNEVCRMLLLNTARNKFFFRMTTKNMELRSK